MNLSDFIYIKENAFDYAFCNELIQLHLANSSNVIEGQVGPNLVDYNFKKSLDYDLARDKGHYVKYGSLIVDTIGKVFEEYSDSLPHQSEFQTKIEFFAKNKQQIPTFQIQKYNKGDGHFNGWHYENASLRSSLRTFVFIIYLNEVNEGGETEILFSNQKIKPKVGTVLIHPAFYPFVHRGNMPISNDKYILTGWLEYTTLNPHNLQ